MSAAQPSASSTPRPMRHEQIALALRHELAQGRWSVGSRLPTTRVLAHQHRASLLTVRQALAELSDQGLIRSRRGSGVYVAALPSEHQPRPFSRLSVVVPSERFFSHALKGIQSVAEARGIQTTVEFSRYDRTAEIDLVTRAIRSGTEALILAPARHSKLDDPLWHDLLAELRIPAVLIERNPPEESASDISHVTSNVQQGTRDAVNHLIAHGRRRIALYAQGKDMLWPEISDGFVEALHRADLPLIGELMFTDSDDLGADAFVERCLDHGADALFCTRETDTIRLLAALRRQGCQVPEDIAVMEFCDERAESAEVPLSGIVQRRTEVGAMAVHLLLRRFEADADFGCHVSYRPRLILRRSCGCPESP